MNRKTLIPSGNNVNINIYQYEYKANLDKVNYQTWKKETPLIASGLGLILDGRMGIQSVKSALWISIKNLIKAQSLPHLAGKNKGYKMNTK